MMTQQQIMRTMMDIITVKQRNSDPFIKDVVKAARRKGIKSNTAEEAIFLLKRNGFIYSPYMDKIRITEY